MSGGYSEIANDQLDEIEATDTDLYNDILTVCEWILDNSAEAKLRTPAVRTAQGIVFRSPVPARHPYKVFWSSAEPRIEAVFPYP